MYAPLGNLICPLAFVARKFCYKVRDELSLDNGLWLILDVKLAQLYSL